MIYHRWESTIRKFVDSKKWGADFRMNYEEHGCELLFEGNPYAFCLNRMRLYTNEWSDVNQAKIGPFFNKLIRQNTIFLYFYLILS
jgi:hypothetical protein